MGGSIESLWIGLFLYAFLTSHRFSQLYPLESTFNKRLLGLWQDEKVKEMQATIEQGERHIAGLTAQLQVCDLPTFFIACHLKLWSGYLGSIVVSLLSTLHMI